ncbi:hypothetical protein DTO280E4_4309 [Paecilomyces variotii]|nr:hypothetical protein DTO280E4_4309 [Paecilomyces variotii]
MHESKTRAYPKQKFVQLIYAFACSTGDFGVGRVTKQLDSLWPTGLHHSNHFFVHYWGRRDSISSIMVRCGQDVILNGTRRLPHYNANSKQYEQSKACLEYQRWRVVDDDTV